MRALASSFASESAESRFQMPERSGIQLTPNPSYGVTQAFEATLLNPRYVGQITALLATSYLNPCVNICMFMYTCVWRPEITLRRQF